MLHPASQSALLAAAITTTVTTMEPQSVFSLGPWTEYVDTLESYHTIEREVQFNFKQRQLLLTLEDFEASGFVAALNDQRLPCKLGLLHTEPGFRKRVSCRFI